MAIVSSRDHIMFNSNQVVLIVPADDTARRHGCRSEVHFADGRKLHLAEEPTELQTLIAQAERG